MNMISEEVLALEPDIIAWRRHMHQNPELSFQAVSYTHLDVYKRQAKGKAEGLSGSDWRMLLLPTFHAGAGAVSYTHLDVYKRQIFYSAIFQFVQD